MAIYKLISRGSIRYPLGSTVEQHTSLLRAQARSVLLATRHAIWTTLVVEDEEPATVAPEPRQPAA